MTTRILIATALTTVLATGTAAAYQTAPPAKPPATQTPPVKPPVTQTPPPAQTPPPLLPTAPKPPAPVLPFPADAKVAFVSLQMVVSESKLGKLGQSQMADFAKKISDDLGVLQKSAADLQKEIDSGILSAAVIQSKRSQLEQLSRDLTHKQEDAQAKLDEYNGQLLNGFSDKVIPIVEELRAERGLWVILGVQDNQGGLAVLAVNPALDLSPEVIKRLDIKYPGTAGK
jgi:Skp family chaperone for outer membrane proteins